MFQKIPTIKPKLQKLLTEIGGGWYTEEITKGLPPFRRPKICKKSQEKYYEILKLYEANRH